jgi:hypothetical protein
VVRLGPPRPRVARAPSESAAKPGMEPPFCHLDLEGIAWSSRVDHLASDEHLSLANASRSMNRMARCARFAPRPSSRSISHSRCGGPKGRFCDEDYSNPGRRLHRIRRTGNLPTVRPFAMSDAPPSSPRVAASWRQEEGDALARLIVHGRHSDLVVLGRPGAPDGK